MCVCVRACVRVCIWRDHGAVRAQECRVRPPLPLCPHAPTPAVPPTPAGRRSSPRCLSQCPNPCRSTHPHRAQIVAETLPALQRLKAQGLVRYIGITGLPLAIYRYVLDRYGGVVL